MGFLALVGGLEVKEKLTYSLMQGRNCDLQGCELQDLLECIDMWILHIFHCKKCTAMIPSKYTKVNALRPLPGYLNPFARSISFYDRQKKAMSLNASKPVDVGVACNSISNICEFFLLIITSLLSP